MQLTLPTRDAADEFLQKYIPRQIENLDANDFLYAFDASRDYNPEPMLSRIKAPLLAINSADDQVNPPELGILEREIKRVRNGRHVLIPISDETRGHGTHSLPAIWKQHLQKLLEDTEPAASKAGTGVR